MVNETANTGAELDIHLRDVAPSDAPQIQLLCNNRRVSQYLSNNVPFPYTLQDAETFIHLSLQKNLVQMIQLETTLVGCIGLIAHTSENLKHSMALGFWLGEPYWGRGILSHILPRFIQQHVRRHFPHIHRLYAQVLVDNIASCRVLEKAGFQREGIRKDGFLKQGIYYDDIIYGLILK
jgi:RimJ/RimL family protein N-acetyltransferase